MQNGSAIQNALQTISGQRTVPNIFIGGNHVGGNSEFQGKVRSGEIKGMLNEANVQHGL